MNPIQKLHINYFKFFTDNSPIEVNGKHLLIYGENGSGKSSLYWALYTLLETVYKTDTQQNKYFAPTSEPESLLNLNTPSPNDAFVSLELADGKNYRLALGDYSIRTNNKEAAEATSRASDFLNYRFMFRLIDFRHRDEIDLFSLFEKDVFPYIKTRNSFQLIHQNKQSNDFNEIWNDLKEGRSKEDEDSIGSKIFNLSINQKEFAGKLKLFIQEVNTILTDINVLGNQTLQADFGYSNIQFALQCVQEFEKLGETGELSGRESNFPDGRPKIHFTVPEYEGLKNVVKKPQSFLNEAKLTAIGIAIRFAILTRRLDYADGADFQLLVLDDLLISLDMSNREKVLKLIFSNYLSDYQVFILTHDRVLFEFVRMFIDKKSNREQWSIYEMYEGESDDNKIKFPVIIDSKANYFEKADSYFKAKDYTACSFYLRKELERLVKERLTDEQTRTFDDGQKFHTLKYLWDKMVERYAFLNSPVSEDLKEKFESSKIMVLNAQAHDNLSFPVYKLEIEKAIELIKEISVLKIPNKIFLLFKGMSMEFRHPKEDYSLFFGLLQDFYIDNLDATKEVHYPICQILSWQYKKNEFWDFTKSQISIPKKEIEHRLEKVIDTLINNVPLGITEGMVLENTFLLGGIWSLKDVIDKSGIKLTINPQKHEPKTT